MSRKAPALAAVHSTVHATALVAAAFLAGPALAQTEKADNTFSPDVVRASDPGSVVAFFEDAGYPVRLSEDNWGDPLVEYRVNGDKMSLYFYGCDDNVDCLSLQFYAGYRTEDDVDLEMLNIWNSENRFARAYLTDSEASRIEMDIPTGRDGLSRRDFQNILELWLDSVDAFEDFIGW